MSGGGDWAREKPLCCAVPRLRLHSVCAVRRNQATGFWGVRPRWMRSAMRERVCGVEAGRGG